MVTRRRFIEQGIAVVSLGLAVPSVFSRALIAAAEENGSSSLGHKTLIVVQLQGGLDGMNAVIPYSDGAYHDNRPTLAIKREEMLVVNDRIAFHPSMAPMKDLFEKGNLAIVEGVGYPNPNFSHFTSRDIWQSADPDGKASDGWIGRYFEDITDFDGQPLAGLSVGTSLPSAFESGKLAFPSVESVETYGLAIAQNDRTAEARRSSLLKLYDHYRPAGTPFAALLDTTMDAATQSSADLATAHSRYKPAVTYPNSSLATGLRLLAELIDSGGATGATPLRIGHVAMDGFDTHTQEPQRLTTLLTDLSSALSAFWQDVSAHGHAGDVLLMTWSEFGRRVHENAQSGTDHGSVGPMFVLGGRVKGGFYGEPSSLTNLDNGNLRYTTDFRSVYATVLDGWMQAPADDILHGHFDRLPMLSA